MYEHDGDGLIPAEWPCIGKKRIIQKAKGKISNERPSNSITSTIINVFLSSPATTKMMAVCIVLHPEKKATQLESRGGRLPE